MFDTPIHTNERSVDRVLQAGLPVVLAFWQRGSHASVGVQPMLDRVAKTYSGRLLVAKVDVASEPSLARRYGVTRVPTLVVVRDGKQLAQTNGVADEAALGRWLDAVLRGETASAPHGATTPLEGAPAPANARPATSSSSRTQNDGTGPVTLTDGNFDAIIGQNDRAVLVDFWAPWCGPCRAVAPVVEQLASEFAGRAVVGKLNVDENPRVAGRYGIRSIPALFVFRRGEIVERIVGAQPAAVIRQALARHSTS
jgi:thioredoxin 1